MKYKMQVVKLSDIVVNGRFRKEMGNIDELANSIKEKGLIQPISVNEQLHLLAGGRRYTACTKLGLEEVPVVIREGSDQVDAREVELMENLHRKDMTWQESAELTAEIHRLHQSQFGNWGIRKTAELIDQNHMNVQRALKLDAAMRANPGVAECKTADDAQKLIKKVEEQAIVAELAKRQQNMVKAVETGASGGKLEKGLAIALRMADNNYIVQDVFDGLAGLKTDGVVDFIECDPPYGVDLGVLTDRKDKGADLRGRDTDYHEIADEHYPEFLKRLSGELYRVSGKNSWMVFWFAFRWYPEVITALTEAGWKPDLVPALWVKDNGRTPRPDILLGRSYEPFIICRKGTPTVIKQGTLNTYMVNPEKVKYHPAQRPVQLMEDIINTFVDEGRGTVLVPFLGSGATLRACYNLGHRAFGFDTNNEYKDKFMLAVEEDTKRLLAKE
jgi:ParB family chromosome partitioning protein